jgi:thioredoxin reductase
MSLSVETAIVGAGPYGLSIAAHLHARGASFQIFGTPMQTWREHMPEGMLLKSDGFASNLSDPGAHFTLGQFCQLNNIQYDNSRVPVELKTFINYGMAFQARMVPNLDPRQVASIERTPQGFHLRLDDGEEVNATQVVLAVGITHFAHLPPEFTSLPPDLLTHSSAHRDVRAFRGKSVAVVGGGASAIDLAALLHEAGASVTIVARRAAITFHDPPSPRPRSFLQRLRRPTSGLGPGWPSRFYTDAPRVFRQFPESLRMRIVQTHLGPAPGWPMKERVYGKVPMILGVRDLKAASNGAKARLTFLSAEGNAAELETDHVICATGYRVDLSRLAFLAPELRKEIDQIAGAPVLSSGFQASVPGLYFVGIAAANSFGPMMRFAFGADYTARRITRYLLNPGRRATSAKG